MLGLTSSATKSSSTTVYNPPAAPTLSAPSVGAASVTVSGIGVAGDTVWVDDGANAVAHAVVASNAAWSTTVTLSLGTHTLSAYQTDPVSGLSSTSSGTATYTAYAPPAAPTVSGSVSGFAVTAQGAGVAGATLSLYDGGNLVTTVTVAANGTWSATWTPAPGKHTLTATQTSNVSGLTSALSAGVTVSTPPPAPTVSAPASPAPPR